MTRELEIEPLVQKFREYKTVQKDIDGAQELVKGGDAEKRALAEEELTSLEDYELWLRISASGWRATAVPGPLALYRRSAGQMSADRRRMLRRHCSWDAGGAPRRRTP